MSFSDLEIFESFAEAVTPIAFDMSVGVVNGRKVKLGSKVPAKQAALKQDRVHCRVGFERKQAKHRAWMKARYAKRKAAKLCLECGRPSAVVKSKVYVHCAKHRPAPKTAWKNPWFKEKQI